MLNKHRSYKSRSTTRSLPPEQPDTTDQTGAQKRKRSDKETVDVTDVYHPVSEWPTPTPSKSTGDNHLTSEPSKLEKSYDMFIKCIWTSGIPRRISMIGLNANMDGSSFYENVWSKVQSLSEDVGGLRTEFKDPSIKQVLRKISSTPEDSSRWPECRDALSRERD